jgi:hypothetical protein
MVAAAIFGSGLPVDGHADIFKWVDDQGTLHFTDDISSIPPSKRDAANAPFLKEPPPSAATTAKPEEQPPSAPQSVQTPPEVFAPDPGEHRIDALQRQIEQLKAKIAAKEALIRTVDEKRSLATNPLRNRLVDPPDWELYQKYQSELPGDRERLRQLESSLSGSR